MAADKKTDFIAPALSGSILEVGLPRKAWATPLIIEPRVGEFTSKSLSIAADHTIAGSAFGTS